MTDGSLNMDWILRLFIFHIFMLNAVVNLLWLFSNYAVVLVTLKATATAITVEIMTSWEKREQNEQRQQKEEEEE